MTPEQLLRECETLTHNGRMFRMVELGRAATKDADVASVLASLAQGDAYQRVLAVQSSYGSRASAPALQALSDPSRRVRACALRVVANICSDEELQSAFGTLVFDLKIALIRRLHRHRRQAPIDRHLEELAARNDEDLKKLLPFGSRVVVERYLEQVSEQLDLVLLCRLARHYPDLAAAHVRARITTNTEIDPQLLIQANAILPLLAHNTPDLALDLVRALSVANPLARLGLQPLVRTRPREMADLLFQSNEQSSLRFDSTAHRLDSEHLLTLFKHYPGTISTQRFAKLGPQQRLAIYLACGNGWRNSDGVLEYSIVAALPTEQREQEGRRHLDLPALATRPLARLPYAAFLPWDEARALLDSSLRSPDAELRGAALKALIAANRYQRTHLAEALQWVRARRNEQDPVRREMLTALAALPHGIWQVEHLDDLAQVISDALNAPDLSSVTAQAVEQLVVHLFPFHPEWSAHQMATVYSKRGRISVYRLDTYLSDADVRRIAPVLLPILRSWQRRESEGLLVGLAQALDRRLQTFSELADLLETVLAQTLNAGYANTILSLFLKHCRARVYLLIPRLLRQDKSAITLWSVYTYLHSQRQDLLTPFLGQHAYKGRFSTGKTRFVLPLQDGFERWTVRQQETFARTLLEVANEKDQHRSAPELMRVIHHLAAMPFIDPAPLIAFASDERQPVREVAIRVLGRLDAGHGIPTLIAALNDERARIAIYALRYALLTMPKTEALALLRAVPMTQVTVAKEIVRLIGDLAFEPAYRALLALEAGELHRDVRVALLRALWAYPEQPETWEIFTRAAQSPDTAIARGIVQLPTDNPSPLYQRRLVELTATLLDHPEPEVRMETLRWRSQHPLTDREHALFTRLLALLNSPLPDECKVAARAIYGIYTGNDAALVGQAIENILSNRRALQTICSTFAIFLLAQQKRFLPTTRAMLAALAKDPLTISMRVELIIKGLPWDEVAPELLNLANELHAGALRCAELAIQKAASRPDARLFDLETTLAASEDERLRWLALTALVAQTGQANGWNEERLARLKTYQADPAPLVAETAQFIFPR